MEENSPNSTESTEIRKNKHYRCVYSKGHSIRMECTQSLGLAESDELLAVCAWLDLKLKSGRLTF